MCNGKTIVIVWYSFLLSCRTALLQIDSNRWTQRDAGSCSATYNHRDVVGGTSKCTSCIDETIWTRIDELVQLIDWLSDLHEIRPQSPVNRLQADPTNARGKSFDKALVYEGRARRQRNDWQQEIVTQNGNMSRDYLSQTKLPFVALFHFPITS